MLAAHYLREWPTPRQVAGMGWPWPLWRCSLAYTNNALNTTACAKAQAFFSSREIPSSSIRRAHQSKLALMPTWAVRCLPVAAGGGV